MESQQDWLALERYAIGNFHFNVTFTCMSNSMVLLFLEKSFHWKNSGFILLFVFYSFFDIANYNATYCSS